MRRFFLYIAIISSVTLSCSRQPAAPGPVPAPSALARYRTELSGFEGAARALVGRLGDRELCAQVLMVGVGGRGDLPRSTRDFLERVPAGAVILFAFNIPEDARRLPPALDELGAVVAESAAGIPPFVAVDHEGGAVVRFKTGVTRLPSPRSVGALEGRGADAEAARLGALAASELKALGVTLNLAPVVEADSGGFLGDRAYASDPARSGAVAASFVRTLQAGGVAATAKHYPGNAAGDPHRGAVVLDVDLAAFESRYEAPFARAIEANVAFVLLSHVTVTAVDPGRPATLSRELVTGRLKERLGFPGVTLTDDIAMRALAADSTAGEAAVLALLSGADMVMASGSGIATEAHDALLEALGSGRLPRARLVDAATRIVVQKLRFGVARPPAAGLASR